MKSSAPPAPEPVTPSDSRAMFILARSISSGLGSGFSPVASGTVGSGCAGLVWLFFLSPPCPTWIPIVSAVLVSMLGVACTHYVVNDPHWLSSHSLTGSHKGHLDPKEVVVDEWAGMLITLLPLSALQPENPSSITIGLISGFFVFRALDVLKPGLIGRAEKFPGAIGIMADDIVAGICGASILALFLFAMYPT